MEGLLICFDEEQKQNDMARKIRGIIEKLPNRIRRYHCIAIHEKIKIVEAFEQATIEFLKLFAG